VDGVLEKGTGGDFHRGKDRLMKGEKKKISIFQNGITIRG